MLQKLQLRLILLICDDNHVIDYNMVTGAIILQCKYKLKSSTKKSLLRYSNVRKDWVKWSVQTVDISLDP